MLRCLFVKQQILLVICVFVAWHFNQPDVASAQNATQAIIHDSVQKVASAVNESYFDAKLGNEIQTDLLSRLDNDEFDNVGTLDELAERLTARLLAMTNDKHLVVARRQLEKLSEPEQKSEIDEEGEAAARAARREATGRRDNFGMQRFEILPGNIAYLNFTSFYRDYEIADILAAKMKMAANADAVILDMRFNMGGSTGAIPLLCSYFFEGPTRKLFDVVDRERNATTYATDPTVENRNGSRTVYVLVHPTTFSAGEGLAFIMQDQKRGIVIGETTAGAANPGRPVYVNEWFEVNIPNGQVRAANSGKNWEGTGVTPDIDSQGKDALMIAHQKALEKLIETTTDEVWRNELKSVLQQLKSADAG